MFGLRISARPANLGSGIPDLRSRRPRTSPLAFIAEEIDDWLCARPDGRAGGL
jgi:hypothetical protein